MSSRNGDLLDIEFTLKTSGEKVVLVGVGIKVFDALRTSKPNQFTKHFIWGDETGIAVSEIACWKVLQQYDDEDGEFTEFEE